HFFVQHYNLATFLSFLLPCFPYFSKINTSYFSLNLPADSIFLYQKSWLCENNINSCISFPSRLSISIINLKSFAHDSRLGFLCWGLLWSISLYNNSASFKWCVSNFNLERDVLLVSV